MPFDHSRCSRWSFASLRMAWIANPGRALIQQHRAIALILIGFIALGTVYSVVTPLFEASDELWHYPFVKHLADGEGLPVQDPRIEQPWRQEGSQPPLYYALGALATFWIDTSDFAEVRWLNPHADIGLETADGNLNMIVHSERESFPYRGTALAVHIVRFLSVLMGIGTVLCTYLIALEVFPKQKTLAAGAAAFNAFVPMFLFISGSVNNDNLTILLCSLTLLILVRLMRSSSPPSQTPNTQYPTPNWPSRQSPISILHSPFPMLGLIIGLGALSKASALGLIPLTALALALPAWQRRTESVLRRLARFFGSFVTVLAVSFAVAGWWYLRNRSLYRDPLGLNTFVAIVGPRIPQPTLRQLLGEWEGFVKAFWGLFGGVNVAMEPAVYWVLNALTIVGLVGLMIALGRALFSRFTLHVSRNDSLLILLTWPIALFLALIRWTMTTQASQGRLMFPAISAISVLLALGWSQWVPRRYEKWLLGIVGGLMFALAAIAPFRYIAPAYAKPVLSRVEGPVLSKVEGPVLSKVEGPVLLSELEGIPHRLDVTFGDKARLLGYGAGDEEARPGESVEVTLYWQSLAEMDRDYTVFVHLLDENDLVIAQRDTYPGLGTYPTRLWQVGDAFADRYVLTLSPTVFAPCMSRFEVGLYDFASGERLVATGPDGQPLGDNVRFHQIAVLPGEDSPLPNPVHFDFEGRIALAGYDLDRRTARPGETIHLTLYWRALAEMEEDYTAFTHVLGEEDRLWAQMDSQPQGGAAPTSSWQVGQVVEDHYDLTIKPDTPPDVYDIEVGLYLAATGQRLGVLDEGGRLRDNRVLLSKVRVVSP